LLGALPSAGSVLLLLAAAAVLATAAFLHAWTIGARTA
jgi:hypothetical protein